MKTTILHDSDASAAVIVIDGRALELVFNAHRLCGIEANEAANWFLKRCEWRETPVLELAANGGLRDAFEAFGKELEAAGVSAKRVGQRHLAGDALIEAALRDKLKSYLDALQQVTATGDPDAEIVLNDALAMNDWSVEIAASDAVCTIEEFKSARCSL